MKTLLITLLILVASGCARTSVVTTTTPNGTNWDVRSTTLFKDVKDINAVNGPVNFSMGSSTSTMSIPPEVIACVIAPSLCQ